MIVEHPYFVFQVRARAGAGLPAAPGRPQEGQRDGQALHRGRGRRGRQKREEASFSKSF